MDERPQAGSHGHVGKFVRLFFCLILSMAASLDSLVHTLPPEQRKAVRDLEKVSIRKAMQNRLWHFLYLVTYSDRDSRVFYLFIFISFWARGGFMIAERY